MSPMLPVEAMIDAIHFACYFFTMLGAALGMLLARVTG